MTRPTVAYECRGCGRVLTRPGLCHACDLALAVCGYCLGRGHTLPDCPSVWQDDGVSP